jgi:AraC family transcriptional activator of mtrCDE
MDSVSHLIRLARLRGTVDVRCLLSGPTTMHNPASAAGEAPFHLLVAGSCTLEVAGRLLELRAGDAVLLPAGQPHRVHGTGTGAAGPVRERAGAVRTVTDRAEPAGPGDPAQPGGADGMDLFCGHYSYRPGAGELLFRSLPDPLHVPFGTEADSPARLLSTLMRGEAGRQGPGSEAILSALCDALLAMLLRGTPEHRLGSNALWTAVADPALRRAIDAVLREPGRDWTINELAGRAAMSRATFVRHFGRRTGTTVGELLTRTRMMTAANLLTETDRPVHTIAIEVGYRSESAFGRAFRLATGQTPARFRRAESSPNLGAVRDAS